MKRLLTYKGHSVRSILFTVLTVGCVGVIGALGIAQALTVEDQPDATGYAGRHGGGLGQICEPAYCPTPPLLYKNTAGKGVQRTPVIYPIFWGSNWTTKGSVLNRQAVKMYTGLSGSSYQGILTQYFDANGRISSTVTVATPYTDSGVVAPQSVTERALEIEVKRAIAANGWPKEFNGQYTVLLAPGSTFTNGFTTTQLGRFCAYHATFEGISYSFVPYVGDEPYFKTISGCNVNGNLNGSVTAAAVHEYAESATDPAPFEGTWETSDEFEVADICDSGLDTLSNGAVVQGLWDNFQNRCSLSDPSPAFVYAITEQASGVTSTTATLRGVVNPENVQAKYHFEYGATTAYGTSAPVPDASAGSSQSNQAVSQAITGLSPNTQYHYVVIASNSTGMVKGRDAVLKTRAAGFRGGTGSVSTFPEKTTLQTVAGGPSIECKSASGEPSGSWTAQAASENAEGAQEALENGPHLLLNIKKWGTCTGPTGLAAKVKCELQIASSSEGGEKETGTGAIDPPGCVVEIGTENLCTIKVAVSGNKGLSAVKLENSEKEVSLAYEMKSVTSTVSETKELCKILSLKGGKEGEMKTNKAFLLEGLKLA